jgi:hypothetical protein
MEFWRSGMTKGGQIKTITVAALVALVCMGSKAGAAHCGSTATGFEAWKKQFADEALGNGVSAARVAALITTNYATATIAADRGQRSFRLSLDQFLAKRGASAIVARARHLYTTPICHALCDRFDSARGGWSALRRPRRPPILRRFFGMTSTVPVAGISLR